MTEFVQAQAAATAQNVDVATYSLTFDAPCGAGNVIVVRFNAEKTGGNYSVSDSEGNIYTVQGISGYEFQSHAIVGGTALTVTVHVSGAINRIHNIALAILEYSDIQPFASNWGSVTDGGMIVVINGTDGVIHAENKTWQPNTNYYTDNTIFGQYSLVSANTPNLVVCVGDGVSGADEPDWSSGFPIVDGTVTWQDFGDPAGTGALAILFIGSDNRGGGGHDVIPGPIESEWTLRATAQDFQGISVYDRLNTWNDVDYVASIPDRDTSLDLTVINRLLIGTYVAPDPPYVPRQRPISQNVLVPFELPWILCEIECEFPEDC